MSRDSIHDQFVYTYVNSRWLKFCDKTVFHQASIPLSVAYIGEAKRRRHNGQQIGIVIVRVLAMRKFESCVSLCCLAKQEYLQW